MFLEQLLNAARKNNIDLLLECLWIVRWISKNEKSLLLLFCSGVLPILMKLLEHTDFKVISVALRIIGDFLSNKDNTFDDHIIDLGLITLLVSLSKNISKSLRKEAYWTLSNIAASSSENFRKLFEEPDLITKAAETIIF